ncbi:hypothetical protein N7462_007758 [Penicillium macrosclerotiorum]|uniref:uncharacterized protein n=1 Tax=Penicillium macrosclerotiorum TaxID=303699 RepID=UPI0025471737|nr:uncharacterized protein N7462_007758 [Penicillium macrosclerotiorum]KAJ5679514.1 hypothetical protein N7462_007758 [Penicillium macrosclerotiorum]
MRFARFPMSLLWWHWVLCLPGGIDATSTSPYTMTWSNKTFGPDGPWQAISVGVGSPEQEVALYPGGQWSSTILLSTLCDNTTKLVSSTCFAETAGLFNYGKSVTVSDYITDPSWGAMHASVDGYADKGVFYETLKLGGGTNVPNVSITGVKEFYQTYPNGYNYPDSVGILSMGAPAPTHIWDGKTMMFIADYLYASGSDDSKIPSYSWAMHIGSAALGIPGSLMLGGYDQNRIMGDISAQPFTSFDSSHPGGNLVIGLQDIGLGVATGGSPWSFTEKSGLLAESNSSISAPVTLEVDPTRPYLYLPGSTCDAIAANLPVQFNDSLGLYLWEQNDQFQTIVTSPAYLSFTFQKNSADDETIAIKVPFRLLNLTLEAPLVEDSTPYFPCFPTTESYFLGRAFLQAAFVLENYGNADGDGNWYLSQAPGPGLNATSEITSVSESQTAISSTSNSWEESWESYWTPLSSSATSSSSSSSSSSGSSTPNGAASSTQSSSGLSTGAKAGIGVGCGVGGFALIFVGSWFLIQRRRRRQEQQELKVNALYTPGGIVQRSPQELFTSPPELSSGTTHHSQELSGDVAPLPQELNGSTPPSIPRHEPHSHELL